MKQRSILLTSLGNLGDRLSHRYFYFRDGENLCFCDGIGVAEAGTKYVLSQVPIDEIVVLGSGASYVEGEANTSLVLRDWVDFDTEDIYKLSEYSFFRYRILQYLDGLDLEGSDVIYSLDPAEVGRLTEVYRRFVDEATAGKSMLRRDRMFAYLAQEPSFLELLKKTADPMDEKEFSWLKHYAYMDLNDSLRLHPLASNADLEICFIPTNSGTEAGKPLENVLQIVRAIERDEEEQVNLYVDMQGLEPSDGFTMLSILSMLSDENHTRFNIRQIITTHYNPAAFANPIDSEAMTRYEISLLVAGMNAFLRYGKVEMVMDYWRSREIENKHIEQLLFAMQRVDEGISLCNTQDLEFGISLLREIFKETPSEALPELESNIFTIIESGIRRDYGALLEGDTLDAMELVKWAYRKKFYQQALTIIESRIPSDFVRHGILFYAVDEASRLEFLESVNKNYWKENPKNRWQYRELDHYYIKNYGRNSYRPGRGADKDLDFARYRIKALDLPEEGREPAIARAYSLLDDNRPLLEEVLYAYYSLGRTRNIINHAGDRRAFGSAADLELLDTSQPNPNMQVMTGSIEHFIDIFGRALEAIEKRKAKTADCPAPLLIADSEFQAYSGSHKIDPPKDRDGRASHRDEDGKGADAGRDGEKDGSRTGSGKKRWSRSDAAKKGDSGKTGGFGKTETGTREETATVVTKDGKKMVRVTVEIEV